MSISLISDFLEKNGLFNSNNIFLAETKSFVSAYSREQLIEFLNCRELLKITDSQPVISSIVEFIEGLDPQSLKSHQKEEQSFLNEYSSIGAQKSSFKHDGYDEMSALRDKYHQFKREYEQKMKIEIQEEVFSQLQAKIF
jgi:hypothetical protein